MQLYFVALLFFSVGALAAAALTYVYCANVRHKMINAALTQYKLAIIDHSKSTFDGYAARVHALHQQQLRINLTHAQALSRHANLVGHVAADLNNALDSAGVAADHPKATRH